ncbi:MAG: xylulokinase [Planctomycetota bacterium]|jgi:xylulokinase
MYLLGYDSGTSSIKATLMEVETGKAVASAIAPEKEMKIISENPGWAEQDPQTWWDNVVAATQQIKKDFSFDPADVKAIGISYQMHGLVTVDKNLNPIRPCIIWCDSRAVETSEKLAEQIGSDSCFQTLLNLPGNFTASRLKWLKDNEPENYQKIYKAMLPGEYVAMKMTDKIRTTPSGLSEWMLWDFQKHDLVKDFLTYYDFDEDFLGELVPTFSNQGELTKKAAEELGLKAGTPVAYRAGDQPNNALSLNVLNPGEVATTAGTSGVIYGIIDQPHYDSQSRVNPFVHVNYNHDNPRYGVLMCVAGTGILNSWLQKNAAHDLPYEKMNELASQAPVGSEDLFILPYGNSAERTLVNRDIGASIHGLNFNIHNRSHLLRAAQEGIVFALNYGLAIMHDMSVKVETVRAGHANMFLSPLFAQAFANVTGAVVQLYNTDGSQGAARGAGIGAGIYKKYQDAFVGLDCKKTFEPDKKQADDYEIAFNKWTNILKSVLK